LLTARKKEYWKVSKRTEGEFNAKEGNKQMKE
jgi:hypothetical protein